jgi:hypothetical protein
MRPNTLKSTLKNLPVEQIQKYYLLAVCKADEQQVIPGKTAAIRERAFLVRSKEPPEFALHLH